MVQAIILCAGAGTRLGDLTKDTPKPMLRFNNKPFLEYTLECYQKQGIHEFVIPVGYFANKIKSYFKDGKRLKMNIQYAQSSVEVESGGSYKRAIQFINSDFFFVQFGDVFFPLDYNLILNKLVTSGKKALIVASLRNRKIRPYEDPNDLVVDENGLVLKYDRGNISGRGNMLNGGIFLFRKDVLKKELPDIFKLEEVLLSKLVSKKELITFITEQIPYDIGNIKKMERFNRYISNLKK